MMQHGFDNPIYEMSIDSRECAIDLMVNDMPCFSNFAYGGMAVDWPVNTALLRSGQQFFLLKILPYADESIINKKAFVSLKIVVRDAYDGSKSKVVVSNFEPVDFSKFENEVPEYELSDKFAAEIPYTHRGWTSSQIVSNENLSELRSEIDKFYFNLLTIFKTKNLSKYNELNAERFDELCSSFYLNSSEVKKREATLIPQFSGVIQKENIEKYDLKFYGEGKLVGVNIPFEPVGLKFDSDREEDGFIYEQALFHRKEKGGKLLLIR